MMKTKVDIYSKELQRLIPEILIEFTQLYHVGNHSFRHIITTTDNYMVIPIQNESAFLQAYGQGIEGKRAIYLKEGNKMLEFVNNYISFREEYRRKNKITNLWRYRKEDIELRKELKLKNYHEVRRLKKALGYKGFNVVADILIVNNFRSEFRASLNEQIRQWINDKNSEYKTPLSWKQIQAMAKYVRINYYSYYGE